jgi:hypothetical protein
MHIMVYWNRMHGPIRSLTLAIVVQCNKSVEDEMSRMESRIQIA